MKTMNIETMYFLYLRIDAMQKKIEKLEMTISELNGQFLVDRNIDAQKLLQ